MKYKDETRTINNLRRLRIFEKLPSNWNGDGAAIIPKCVIKRVRNLTFNIYDRKLSQPEIFPLAMGEVQLEWEDDNAYLEITIGVVPRFKVYYSKPKKDMK